MPPRQNPISFQKIHTEALSNRKWSALALCCDYISSLFGFQHRVRILLRPTGGIKGTRPNGIGESDQKEESVQKRTKLLGWRDFISKIPQDAAVWNENHEALQIVSELISLCEDLKIFEKSGMSLESNSSTTTTQQTNGQHSTTIPPRLHDFLWSHNSKIPIQIQEILFHTFLKEKRFQQCRDLINSMEDSVDKYNMDLILKDAQQREKVKQRRLERMNSMQQKSSDTSNANTSQASTHDMSATEAFWSMAQKHRKTLLQNEENPDLNSGTLPTELSSNQTSSTDSTRNQLHSQKHARTTKSTANNAGQMSQYRPTNMLSALRHMMKRLTQITSSNNPIALQRKIEVLFLLGTSISILLIFYRIKGKKVMLQRMWAAVKSNLQSLTVLT